MGGVEHILEHPCRLFFRIKYRQALQVALRMHLVPAKLLAAVYAGEVLFKSEPSEKPPHNPGIAGCCGYHEHSRLGKRVKKLCHIRLSLGAVHVKIERYVVQVFCYFCGRAVNVIMLPQILSRHVYREGRQLFAQPRLRRDPA